MRFATLSAVVCLFVACRPARLAAAPLPLITDPVESGGGWVASGGSNFTTGVGGLPPSAGSEYWGSSYNGAASVGLAKTFTGLLVAPGVYNVSIDTADPFLSSGYGPVPLADYAELGLAGLATPRTVVSAVTPSGGNGWTTWEVRYDVPSGSPDVGKPLAFAARFDTPGGRFYSTMLDNLHVTYEAVPEPSLAALPALAALALRRTRKAPRGRARSLPRK